MKYLKIQNNGELDIRLVALMGGTTKANDKYKIGQFGTGLKYTLAYLFRNNIEFKIFSGTTLVDVTTTTENISGNDFDIICINGNRTSITAGMGREWSAWMILRELWCNALDEGGAEKDIETDATPLLGKEGSTTFYLQIIPEIQDVLDSWRKYFIQDFTPMWENEDYAIHQSDSKENLCLYKNGVLIYQHPHTKSVFSYDIKGAEINELREFKGSIGYEIIKALEKPNTETITYFLQNVTEDHYEGSSLDYDWFVQFADVWRESIGDRRIIGNGYYGGYEERGISVDYSNIIKLPKRVYKALTKQFEGVGAVAISDDKTEFFEASFPELAGKISECIGILAGCGYLLMEGVTLKYGFFHSKNTMAAANRSKKQLMFSDALKGLSDEQICAHIIEQNEYIGIKHNKDNHKYSEHFINLYTRSILASHAIEI